MKLLLCMYNLLESDINIVPKYATNAHFKFMLD